MSRRGNPHCLIWRRIERGNGPAAAGCSQSTCSLVARPEAPACSRSVVPIRSLSLCAVPYPRTVLGGSQLAAPPLGREPRPTQHRPDRGLRGKLRPGPGSDLPPVTQQVHGERKCPTSRSRHNSWGRGDIFIRPTRLQPISQSSALATGPCCLSAGCCLVHGLNVPLVWPPLDPRKVQSRGPGAGVRCRDAGARDVAMWGLRASGFGGEGSGCSSLGGCRAVGSCVLAG